jgi:hypothetical protein
MTKIVVFGALIGVMSAQDSVLVEKKLAEAKAQLDNQVKIMSTSMISGPTVKGAPYAAEAVNEMVQELPGGNRIRNSNSTMLYRDSQGRERREEASGREVVITDPVEGTTYILDPKNKTARKTAQHAVNFTMSHGGGGGAGVAVGVGGGGGVGAATTLTENRVFIMASPGSGPETFSISQDFGSSKADRKIEHLPMQTIEGVAAEGTRTTLTIPAGQIGNEQPITTVTERWYSPDLQLTVMTTRSDPRTGTTTYRLTNINRSEPSPSLFQVPAEYTITDKMPMRGVIRPDNEQ